MMHSGREDTGLNTEHRLLYVKFQQNMLPNY